MRQPLADLDPRETARRSRACRLRRDVSLPSHQRDVASVAGSILLTRSEAAAEIGDLRRRQFQRWRVDVDELSDRVEDGGLLLPRKGTQAREYGII